MNLLLINLISFFFKTNGFIGIFCILIMFKITLVLKAMRDEKEIKQLKKKADLASEKSRNLELRLTKELAELERVKNEKSELTKSLTRYQERIDRVREIEKQIKTIEAVEAENKRLKERLEHIEQNGLDKGEILDCVMLS